MTSNPWPLHRIAYLLEWSLLVVVLALFSRETLLDFDSRQLQQTGEHSESATLPILAEIGLRRYGEIPLWNPYMLTGFPHAGDLINHIWNPVATIPVILWGGVNGMKVSIFLSLLVAAFGQWFLAHTFGIRGVFRLWAGLLFALSGGLLLLWRLGWYELLVGAAWFPWCFALLWRALHRDDRLSLVLASLAIFMVLTTGGGYYPFYLGVCLIVLTAVALAFHKAGNRARQLRRAAAVAILAAGLAAVYLVPLADGLRYTLRDAPRDYPQAGSQPIPYALFNYVVSDEAWFRADVLNRGSGFNWYYIGFLPLLALLFTPWVFSRFFWRRRGIFTLFLLLLVLLLWQANRHAPVRYLYDWLPFLYTFRFPNRLLIIATIPLVALAALTLQGLLVWARRGFRGMRLGAFAPAADGHQAGVAFITLVNLAAAALLLLATVNVYQVNRAFAMHPNPRLAVARETLGWLRLHDTGLYYTQIGPSPYWNWFDHAYELEMPVINFRYNRRVLSMDAQYQPESPFNAQPKYIILGAAEPGPEGATLLTKIREVHVWQQPDALPYAFAVADPSGPINRDTARAIAVHLDGPNRIVVEGAAGETGERLVVLASDYPGWRLAVDGRAASVAPVNGYLGAEMQPGTHTYVFEFRPPQHAIGLAISSATLLLCVGMVVMERRRRSDPAAAPIAGEQVT